MTILHRCNWQVGAFIEVVIAVPVFTAEAIVRAISAVTDMRIHDPIGHIGPIAHSFMEALRSLMGSASITETAAIGTATNGYVWTGTKPIGISIDKLKTVVG